MQMSLLNNQIENMYVALVSLINSGTVLPKKLAFRASINVANMKSIIDAINEVRNSNAEVNKFQEAKKEFMEAKCHRNTDGSVKVVNNSYVFDDTEAVLNEFGLFCKENYPNIETVLVNHLKDVENLLNEKSDVNIQMITEDDLPETLAGNLVTAILPMISTEL